MIIPPEELVAILPAEPAPGHRVPPPPDAARLDSERLRQSVERPEADVITPQEREAVLQALAAGVVPRLGLRHIQVGRTREIAAVTRDIERIARGGAGLRLIVGDNGSGKTLLLALGRAIALERNLAVVGADLGPTRRLHALGGEARALLGDLVGSLATRDRPEGGALPSLLESFMAETMAEAHQTGVSRATLLDRRLAPLRDLAFGFEFAAVLARYGRAYEQGDESAKTAALRWFRAEYGSRGEARAALGVHAILDDAQLYDALKLLARLVALVGYGGLLVVLDEMVALYKITSASARAANYEQVLRIVNDILQGNAAHIGVLMGGTPEFLMDSRRGLFSYPALESRMAPNRFVRDGLADCAGPVIRLEPLRREDLFILLKKIRNIVDASLPDEAVLQFVEHCSQTLGDASFRTPRQTVTAFVGLSSVLEQNPGLHWQDLIRADDICVPAGDDELTYFRL